MPSDLIGGQIRYRSFDYCQLLSLWKRQEQPDMSRCLPIWFACSFVIGSYTVHHMQVATAWSLASAPGLVGGPRHRYHPSQSTHHAQHRHRYSTRVSSTGDGDEDDPIPLFVDYTQSRIPPNEPLLRSIDRVKNSLLEASNDTSAGGAINNDALLRRIVQKGISFQQANREKHRDDEYEMQRVPGCIATVLVRATLSRNIVTISGKSDALLSGGLIAIVADVLSGVDVTAHEILQLDANSLTSALGLKPILNTGRNDGVASMIRVIQDQIRSLLGDSSGNAIQPSSRDAIRNETSDKPTVAMLLSGGVDSSVALHLLLQQGYNVTAYYLRIWLEDELAHLGECPWEDDLHVCQEVCEHAGNVPLETVSLGKEYRDRVVQYTIEEAQQGRTPNPDIMCNSRVKFGCFLEYIDQSGMKFDHVASGHYARLEDEPRESSPGTTRAKRLFRAPDPVKDQSYFLCALTQKQLSKVLFPIGQYKKSEVRQLASEFNLPNRNRPDSQGLCFLGKVKFDEFLSSYLGSRPGDVVDAMNGEVIGKHNGLWYHTVGQRKGIGKVMFPLATAHGPWYVVAKDQSKDVVYVSNRYDEDDFAKARSEFEVEDVRWISNQHPAQASSDGKWEVVRFDMKIRHGPKIVQGSLQLKGDGSSGNVKLDLKDGGLAPGQYVVFYSQTSDEVLGAGVISEKHWASFLKEYKQMVGSEL